MGRLRLTEVLLALSIPVCGAAWAQAPDANQPNEWKRATTTHRPAAYPKVGSDGGGWFQFNVPNAQKDRKSVV